MISNHHKSKRKEKYTFNPFEIVFYGNFERKEDIIKSVISNLNEKYNIGYYSENSYNKKDLIINTELNVNTNSFNLINKTELDLLSKKTLLLNNDIVFINSNINNNSPKIVFVNNEEEYKSIKSENINNISAYITNNSNIETNEDIIVLNINDINKISNFILDILNKKASETKLYGLILTGGKSTRMKQDKSLIEYYGKPQYQHIYELIKDKCEDIFISVNENEDNISDDFKVIKDKIKDCGPSGGILSAMMGNNNVSWLVIACDLPYLDEKTINYLIEKRNHFKFATVYKSTSNGFPEPLCAIYEPKSKTRLLQFLSIGYDCPRKFLLNSEINLLIQENEIALSNVNTVEEYNSALKYIEEVKK